LYYLQVLQAALCRQQGGCFMSLCCSSFQNRQLIGSKQMGSTPGSREDHARQMCVSLKGFDCVMDEVNEKFAQEQFKDIKQLTKAAQSRLAFLGDRIIHLAVSDWH
jgi:hypothetical protein